MRIQNKPGTAQVAVSRAPAGKNDPSACMYSGGLFR
jgi:hypothetical protein